MDFDERILSTTTLTSISTFSIYQFPILSKIPSSNNKKLFVHVRSRNNYHHLTFSHENRKNNSLLKSLFLFGVFNENKKKSLSFHSSTKIYLKNIINQKYFLCQRFLTFYKYSRFLLKNTFNFIKKRF